MRPKLTHLVLLAVAAATLLTTGCRRRVQHTETGLQTGQVSDRRVANLRRLASRDTGCHEAMLDPRELERGIYEVVGTGGCQVVRHYVMSCRHRYACRWEAVVPIEQQAMNDLGCAPDAIWVRATGHPMTRQVFACGVVAPYQLQCWEHGCAWAQSGAPQQAAPPGDVAPTNVAPQPDAADVPTGDETAPAPQPPTEEGAPASEETDGAQPLPEPWSE